MTRKRAKLAAGAVVFLVAGLASSVLSTGASVESTRVELEEMATRYREESQRTSSWQASARRPLSWAKADEVRDALADIGQANYFAPALVPSERGSVQTPWALAIALSPPLPFVVRVSAGINMTGQWGGLWIHYYLAFFGAHWRVHQQFRGAF